MIDKRWAKALLFSFGIFVSGSLYAVSLSGSHVSPPGGLTVRQRVESVFHNGIREAQSRNDVFGQVRAMQKALHEIRDLRAMLPKQLKNDERRMDHREKQLRRMIAKETPSEVL